MTTWKAHVATGVLTLAAGSIALALWWGVERERSPRLGRKSILAKLWPNSRNPWWNA
jgi:hypothetical protein